MRALQVGNRTRTGFIGIVVLTLLTVVAQSFLGVPMLFATAMYYGQFKDSAGIKPGDKVRIDGIDVGEVRSVALHDQVVAVGFSLTDRVIGTQSRMTIRTDTILGRKSVEVQPLGPEPLRPDGTLPIEQTMSPYQLSEALTDVTKNTSGWDIDTVRRSLNVLSETVDQTQPHLSAALDGVRRLSQTVATRDDDIKALLANANKIAEVLGQRGEQIDRLLVNAQSLLAAINARGQAIDHLLENVSAVADQLTAVINDNPNLGHVVDQLRVLSGQLEKHKFDLADAAITFSTVSAALSEAVASGPYFKTMVANLLPGSILQPFIDAAFKKRGIDPEQFWRNAGLPAFRFPDPNGTRFPNGAPPPAPTPLEGTPEHPGPAVPPGSPCSYTPPADGLPSPADPLPCADLDQGPFGPLAAGFPPPDVATSTPNPAGIPATPGVPSAALPGEAAPVVPGIPVPFPSAPPGARTEPAPLLPLHGPPPLAPAFDTTTPTVLPGDTPGPLETGGR